MTRCGRAGPWFWVVTLLVASFVFSATFSVAWPAAAAAQLIEGLAGWSDAIVGVSSSKWSGARVPYPLSEPRPAASQRLDSLLWPVSVHAGTGVSASRLAAVLQAAEQVFALWSQVGFLRQFGDAGQGGTAGRDLYLVDEALGGAAARLDASGSFEPLDGARAYAVVDARVSSDRLPLCVAEALIEAELWELDPAEAAALRKSSASYFARLLTGERECDGPAAERHDGSPFAEGARESGAAWLERLGAREDGGRGTFLYEMWQFARQRTWEGDALRASPDLIEVIAKTLELQRESFALVAAELAEAATESSRELILSELPLAVRDLPLQPLAAARVRIRLDRPHPGTRLRLFSQGEPGARYTLAATRLSAAGEVLARIEVEPRRDPHGQLAVELDPSTTEVLLSVTNLDDGTPDFDLPLVVRHVTLTIDHKP